MTMSRIPRSKARKPPLSKLDVFLYALVILLGMALCFTVLILFIKVIPTAIAFSRPDVVAFMSGIATVLCPFPIFVAIMLLTIIPAAQGLEKKQPIFGNKSFKPRFGSAVINVFPLFSRDFRDKVYPRVRRKVRRYCLIAGMVLLISILLLPFGLYQGKALSRDGTLRTYNVFGQVSHSSSIDEAEQMVIRITGRRGRHNSPAVAIRYVCQGQTYQFPTGAFDEENHSATLAYMIRLKEQRDGRYEVETNWDRLERFLDLENFTDEERALICELFDYRHHP